jgi:type IV secretory pathway TrbF-like protein
MRFKRAVQRYGRTDEPETPYRRAGQLWDERIGSARAQASNWRLMAFGGLALTTGLSGALVWQSMQSRVVPYVVAVDSLGQPQAVSPAASRIPADRSPARLVPRAVHHRYPGAVARRGADARELAPGL